MILVEKPALHFASSEILGGIADLVMIPIAVLWFATCSACANSLICLDRVLLIVSTTLSEGCDAVNLILLIMSVYA